MEDVRSNIISTAGSLFLRYGIKSVSVDDICKELGMSKKTLYTYFPQKEDLVEAMLAASREIGRAQVRENIRNFNTQQRLTQLEQIIHKLDGIRCAPPLVFDLQKYYPLLFKKHLESVQEGMQVDCEEMIQQGMVDGMFRADLDVKKASEFLAIMHNMMVNVTQEEHGSGCLSHGIEIVLRGLLSEEGKKHFEEARKNYIETN